MVTEPPEASTVQARFAVSTFESGNGARDAAVLSPRLLDAEAHPSLSFTSTGLVSEQGRWSLRGELEVRGVTRLVEARISALAAERRATLRASAQAGIDRYDFGITTYRGLAARRLTGRLRRHRPPGAVMTQTGAIALEITNLRKRYGQKIAVDDLSLRVNEGEIFGILGPNGAGKTTTVECAEGLRHPDGGTRPGVRRRPLPGPRPRRASWSASSSRRASCPTRSPSPRRSACTRPSTHGTPTPRRCSAASA